ncbi:MAG: hypothetical protein ACLFM3_07220 [Desulfohalobiaceae bacterium]
MKRRILQVWEDYTRLVCPVCRHDLGEHRLVIDNNCLGPFRTQGLIQEIQRRAQKEIDIHPVGHSDLTCNACGAFLVLQVDLTGSFFQKTGMEIQPRLRLFRGHRDEGSPETEISEKDLELIQEWQLEAATTELEEISSQPGDQTSKRVIHTMQSQYGPGDQEDDGEI